MTPKARVGQKGSASLDDVMVELSSCQEGHLLPRGDVGGLRWAGVSMDGTQSAFRQRARRLEEMSCGVPPSLVSICSWSLASGAPRACSTSSTGVDCQT